VRIGPWVELTLTVDHRVVDGVLAARFLSAIRARLERDAV
jgi:pyruvate/2-oxoglutarate dehydrogenase complex dihydrolipoamide acyltransferase (E2) component